MQNREGEVAILLPDNIDFKTKTVDKERHYIMIKGQSKKRAKRS